MACVLLTGGAGYIGSHTAVEMIKAGHRVVVIDNLSNACRESIRRVEEITGTAIPFYENDVRDAAALDRIFSEQKVDAVVHFAGLKAVGESVAKPLAYYRNNIDSTITLLEAMERHGVRSLVFSSSATVYGREAHSPIREDMPTGCTNPYGWTKWMIEQIIRDAHKATPSLRAVILRYFNPVGAHESGKIGEAPNGIPNNLMPYVTQVAVGKRDHLSVFGNDYNTHDGTGVRDYIHVTDLALGHVAALNYLENHEGLETVNLGTGTGYSVLDLVHAFERASGVNIPYEITARRPGDIDECFADPTRAKELLGWQATKSLDDMCADSWRWQKTNPNGYEA